MPGNQKNPAKILQALIERGPMSKWELMEKTALPYPRVQEAINTLQKNKSIRIVGRKTSKKNLKMKIYGLAFKGVIEYFASIQLKQPRTIGTTEETEDDFKKRLDAEYKVLFKQIASLHDSLKAYGNNLNFVIFNEIDWLAKNYGPYIYDLILEISRTVHSSGVPYQFTQMFNGQKAEQKKLKQTLQMIKRYPSLGKTTFVTDQGKGGKEEIEIDVPSETMNRLNEIAELTPFFQIGENEFLMNSFAYAFLERLSLMKRRGNSGNKSLWEVARNLLEKRKEQTIIPLERVVKQLET
jgi:sugar-specific transcriptional regulator TrmB